MICFFFGDDCHGIIVDSEGFLWMIQWWVDRETQNLSPKIMFLKVWGTWFFVFSFRPQGKLWTRCWRKMPLGFNSPMVEMGPVGCRTCKTSDEAGSWVAILNMGSKTSKVYNLGYIWMYLSANSKIHHIGHLYVPVFPELRLLPCFPQVGRVVLCLGWGGRHHQSAACSCSAGGFTRLWRGRISACGGDGVPRTVAELSTYDAFNCHVWWRRRVSVVS